MNVRGSGTFSTSYPFLPFSMFIDDEGQEDGGPAVGDFTMGAPANAEQE